MVDERSHADAGGDAGLRGRDLIGLGGLLAGCVIVGMVLGLLVDDATGSEPVGVLVGIGLGVLLGAVAFVVRVRAALRG
jgi:F0F1-type ATP synthase assembly protein I